MLRHSSLFIIKSHHLKQNTMRLDALLSQHGYCSRKDAKAWVKKGRITNSKGEPFAKADAKVEPQDILIDGCTIPFLHGLYIALNKPLGYTCSHKEQGQLVDELLPEQWQARKGGVQSVGRLDKETSGLLLLTDDGQFVHRLTSPKKHVPKRYRFTTEAPIPQSAIAQFASGEHLLTGENTPCLPAELHIESETSGTLILHEGRYHQVRRMLASVGAPVISLHREAIGTLELDSLHLEAGEWAEIDPNIFP